VPSSYTQGQARDFYNRNLYMAAFAQDSWKATDGLTVNYGVRWDRIRPWARKVQPAADAGEGRAVAGVSRRAAGAGVSRRSRRSRFAGAAAQQLFAPRRHCLYSPSFTGGSHSGARSSALRDTTSIRLGYGMFTRPTRDLSAGIMSANPPYGYTYTSAAPPLFESPFTVAATGADAGSASPCSTWLRSQPRKSKFQRQLEPV
jgi:hypothetical protein